MIKKKVLSTLVVLTTLVLSKLCLTASTDFSKNPNPKRTIEYVISKSEDQKDEQKEDDSTVTFAEENVPVENSKVKQKLGKYLSRVSFKKYQSYQLHHKADRYLPRIAEILKSYNIPEDFKYIPLVESGLDPRIVSNRGAGGYWQFMPATARLYGLRVTAGVDDRKDLIKSTHAAARYLKSLHNKFGDWTLVAAAYNLGEGSLRSAIRRQQQSDYYKLSLNSETASYVYKLVSMKEVIENPLKYGYKNI